MAGLSPEALEGLFTSGHLSDFRVTCQGREWPLHKNILCAASDYFRAACERNLKENEDGVLDFPEDDAATVHTLLYYLYTGKYVLEVDREQASVPPTVEDTIAKLRAHFLVYKLSDKTGFKELKNRAYDRFKDGFCGQGSPVIPSPEFSKLMTLIYESTSAKDDLRVQLTKICVRNHETTSTNQAAWEVIQKFEYVAWTVGQKIKDHSDYIYDLYLEQHALNKQNEERVKALEDHFGPGE